ncbi:uncharacterized protein si:ch211-214p13.7 isoform X3 [Ictalurus punctatus]|uniref:Uncharacterized protein si:ch211-214p13.7 isoform X3 n=1 Tax=Ictalurus punctatus TaxID=7998 RepID=A0A979EWB2_ICTPU|nr:uncharacterized protein si:ch211-214p13.7 isoform X3 [Ictalurus punctatus]
MGNLSCFTGRKDKYQGDAGQMSPKEDVLYATIDHGTDHTAGHGTNTDRRDSMDNDCHYAVVMLPSEPVKKLDNNEDCADDYVLMT